MVAIVLPGNQKKMVDHSADYLLKIKFINYFAVIVNFLDV